MPSHYQFLMIDKRIIDLSISSVVVYDVAKERMRTLIQTNKKK